MTTPEFSPLPKSVHPLKYRLTLVPDLTRFTFAGEETVDIEIAQPMSEIVLNAVELVVQSASLLPSGGTSLTARRIEHNESAETVTLHFGGPLPVGRAQLALQFKGQLNDRLHGFYRSTYRGPDGAVRTLAATQFEATDARRAFPCWDEPAVKATFETALVIPSHLTAVSNTLVASETPVEPGLKRVQFRETPRMSTYLLAFIVGELEAVEGRSQDGTLVRVWATPGKAHQGRFALDVAVRLLRYYNDYFGIPYPLEKLDHLAIPDFAAGAMENWGAITYRETALLFDPENSAPGTRQRVAEVVAHEMAHMWFGDLVTMNWWNDLWLNESFASWVATKAVDHLFPEWDMWTQFIVADVQAGLGLDALENSHPIEQEVRDPAEISQLFDAISYSKGASILRMLEQFLGPEQFRKGLHRYLSAHSYGNARTSDLWTALEAESGQPVTAIMDSWVRQTGYPLIHADVRRTVRQPEVRLSQQRFFYSGKTGDPTLWQVPIGVAIKGDSTAHSLLLDKRVEVLRLGPPAEALVRRAGSPAQGQDAPWLKVNAGQTGFYRVQYAEEEWARLIPAVESLELPPADRLGLQADAYALSRAGLLPAVQFIKLASAYRNETDYGVWADLCASLAHLDILLSREAFFHQFQAFGRELLQSVAQRVGWEPRPDEGHLQKLLRSAVLGRLGAFEDADTVNQAAQRFQRFLHNPSSVAPDLRRVVYDLAAQAGGQETYDALARMAREATLQEESLRLLTALARFRQRRLLEQTLQMSLSSGVRTQDTVTLVSAVAGNRNGGTRLAWEYIKDNWPEFYRRYGTGGFAIMRLVSITGSFTSQEARGDVEEFFQHNPAPAAARAIQQSLERIDLNVRFLERNRDEMAKWFGG